MATYQGGGYTMLLGKNKAESKLILADLKVDILKKLLKFSYQVVFVLISRPVNLDVKEG